MGLLLMPPHRTCARGGRRLSKTAAETAVEVRKITEANLEGDGSNFLVGASRVAQHMGDTIEPYIEDVYSKGLADFLKQLMDVARRDTQPMREDSCAQPGVIEIGIN